MLPIEQTDFQQLHKKQKIFFTLFSHELQLISIQSEDRNVTRICRTIDITVMLFLNNFSQVENATLTCQMFNVQTFVHTIIQYQTYNQTYNTNICKDGDYVLYKRFILIDNNILVHEIYDIRHSFSRFKRCQFLHCVAKYVFRDGILIVTNDQIFALDRTSDGLENTPLKI